MVAIATGGTWPRARRAQWANNVQICNTCPRRGQAVETPFHRIWGCEQNKQNKVYALSEEYVSEAYSQWESAECL
eukprot:894472-Pyramimonas_sp.AAC.1